MLVVAEDRFRYGQKTSHRLIFMSRDELKSERKRPRIEKIPGLSLVSQTAPALCQAQGQPFSGFRDCFLTTIETLFYNISK